MTREELKQYVKKSHITYAELSEKSGIPLSTIKAIFGKQTKNPRLDTINAIEAALGLNEKATGENPPHSIDHLISQLKNMPPEKQQELVPVIEHLINAIKK